MTQIKTTWMNTPMAARSDLRQTCVQICTVEFSAGELPEQEGGQHLVVLGSSLEALQWGEHTGCDEKLEHATKDNTLTPEHAQFACLPW